MTHTHSRLPSSSSRGQTSAAKCSKCLWRARRASTRRSSLRCPNTARRRRRNNTRRISHRSSSRRRLKASRAWLAAIRAISTDEGSPACCQFAASVAEEDSTSVYKACIPKIAFSVHLRREQRTVINRVDTSTLDTNVQSPLCHLHET